MKPGSILIGIIAAATAGVLVGMLIAPEKGEDIRKNIKNAVGDWTKKMSSSIINGKEELEEELRPEGTEG